MALTLGPAFGLTGLVLSLPALIDNSISYTTRLREKIHTFKNAGVIFKGYTDEYRIYSNQLEASLLFVKDISPFLSPTLLETLQMAVFQLNTASAVTEQLADRAFDEEGRLRKVWFTLYGKSVLERSLRDVNRCHDLFLRSLHYTVLFGGSKIDTKVDEHVDRAPSLVMVQKLKKAIVDSLKDSSTTSKKLRMEIGDLPPGSSKPLYTGSNIRHLEPSNPSQQHILLERRFNASGTEFMLQKFRELARILSGTSLDMGILPCGGFIAGPQSCDLVFKIPSGISKPRTLRELLSSPINNGGIRHSLTERINLAVKLATAVMYVHTAKLVHKNIRPENILILEPDSDDPHSKYPYTLGTAVLMGFDFARFEHDNSDHRGTDQWEKNIYMHPERQGDHLEVSYNMLHDVYSLGVVLLEIALWKSFVLEERVQHNVVIYKPNPETCRFRDSKTRAIKEPKEIQTALIKKTEDYVPLVLGEKYRDVVLSCLNCLDGSFKETKDLLDEDDILVGLVFIQKILGTLKEISI